MKREIRISSVLRHQLVEEFGTTAKTVYQALHYMGGSELLEGIRKAALERGGQVVIIAPEESVLVDMGDRFVQHYRSGARLEFDKETGNALLYNKDGELRSTHHSVASSLLPVLEFSKNLL